MSGAKSLADLVSSFTPASLPAIAAQLPTNVEQGPESELAFGYATLCMVSLPRAPVARNGQQWVGWQRQHQTHWVQLRSGSVDLGRGPVERDLPHGALARLALMWIITRAVQTRQREIELPGSPRAWLRELGGAMDTRRAQRLHGAMLDLLAADWTFGRLGRTEYRRIASGVAVGQHPDWPTAVRLSEALHEDLTTSKQAVPLDAAVLRALSDSALALDLYCWAALRGARLHKEVGISWSALQAQHGQEYARARDFAPKARAALEAVREASAALRASLRVMSGGVVLLPRG